MFVFWFDTNVLFLKHYFHRIEIIKKGDDFNNLQIINVNTNDFTTAVPTTRQPPTNITTTHLGVSANNTTVSQSISRRRRDVPRKDDYLPLLEKTINETFFYSKVCWNYQTLIYLTFWVKHFFSLWKLKTATAVFSWGVIVSTFINTKWFMFCCT